MDPAIAEDSPRIYRISIWRYLVMWWALGPFLLVGLGLAVLGDTANGRLAGVAISSLMGSLLLFWHWLARRARLEISPAGVRVAEVGGSAEASWRDIVDIRLDREDEGFVLAASVIPIRPFAWHLRRGDLRAQIERHAPHLVAALAALDAPPSKRPLTAAERRANWLVFLVVVGMLGVGAFLVTRGAVAQAWFFAVGYSIVNPLLALTSGYYAWQLLRRRGWLLGVLTLLLALVMAGWSVQSWIELQKLLGAAR